MIKRFFKKHNKKIFAFIGVLATTICGVLGLTKTYAYSTNTFSSTLGNPTETNNSTFINSSTYQTDGYVDFRVNNNSGYITYITFDLLEQNLPSNFQYSNYIFIINCAYLNTGIVTENTSSGQAVYICQGATTSAIINKTTYMRNYITKNNISYKCIVQGFDINASISTSTGKITIGYRGSQYQSSDTNWQGLRIYNIDILESDKLYTSSYIEDIENQYNELLEDYNELEDNYDTLQDDYDTLEDNYNTLQDNYDTLENDYNALFNTDTNGIWAYFGAFSIVGYNENNEIITLEPYQTFEDFKNSQYNYLNNINIDLSNLKTRYPNYNKFGLICITDNDVTFLLNGLSYQINNNGNTCQNTIILENVSQQINIDYTQLIQMNFKVNFENINNIIQPYDQNRLVEIVGFVFQYNNSNNFSITSLNNEYNNGFITGYQSGQKDQQPYINSLNQDIENLNQQVTNLQTTINDLNYQINAINNQYGLNNLMWTIGGLPFESFKHIWNVNFFGINIADFILGFVTTFIGIYILKKFFF